MSISEKIEKLSPSHQDAELAFITCQSPGQVYSCAFSDAKTRVMKIAQPAEEYIRQLEGIAGSVMPESMLRAIRKECGYE